MIIVGEGPHRPLAVCKGPHHLSFRRKLLDGLVAPLALKPAIATQLLNSLKVTLTPGLTQPKTHNLNPHSPRPKPDQNF